MKNRRLKDLDQRASESTSQNQQGKNCSRLKPWQKTMVSMAVFLVYATVTVYCYTKVYIETTTVTSEDIVVEKEPIPTEEIVVTPVVCEEEVYEPEITPEQQLLLDDLEYIAHCVYAEAGNQDALGKAYVADCILNRFDTGRYKTYADVINEHNDKVWQFSCVANGSINKVEPDEETYAIIVEEFVGRKSYDILYFRTKHYHTFGTPAFKYGAHYFSTN